MMNLVSTCIFTVAFLCDSASAARGVGFSTGKMSEKPSKSMVIDQILPDLKDKLGISMFRIYDAVLDAPYVADLIRGNRDTKFIVGTGRIWHRDSEGTDFYELSSDDVSRYLTDWIDEVSKPVKAALGDEYEWLDNVSTLAYFNEPITEYRWFEDKFTHDEYAQALNRLNGMVQDFFNTYKNRKYSSTITIAPISCTVTPNLTRSLVAESLKLQAEAGAPAGVYVNMYGCHPISFVPPAGDGTVTFQAISTCIGSNGTVSSLENQVVAWNELIQDVISSEGIPVDPTDVKFTITESGYPTSGEPYLSEYLSAQYYASTIRQMEDPDSPLYGVDVFFFEALDEDLKREGPWGTYWGLMTADGKIKEQIAKYWPKPDTEPLHHSNNLGAEEL